MGLNGDESKVLTCLRSTSGSRATGQIASSARIPSHVTVRILLRLRDLGFVEKTVSGWRAKGTIDVSAWTPGKLAAVSEVASSSHQRANNSQGLRDDALSKGKLFDNHVGQAPSINAASRWADFRRLCLYYAECIRLEERASISAYAKNEGKDFVTLHSPIDWRTLSSGCAISVSLDDEWEIFLRQSRIQSASSTLYLGAPLDIFIGNDKQKGDTYRIISPVFVTSVVVRLNNTTIELQPTNLIEVNHGWLERRLPKSPQRKEFLEQVGLAPSALRDDEQEDLWAVTSFEDAVRVLFACRREWWRDFADLRDLRNEPPLNTIEESGLRNRAVLMIQPTLKYTKRLHRELQLLASAVSDEDLDRTALTSLFPHLSPPKGNCAGAENNPHTDHVAELCLLNDDQRLACVHAINQPLTVVTGPPGTGKSTVVAHAMANSALLGRSALFASRNHQALEAVEPKLNAMTEPDVLMLRPTRPYGAHAAQFEWYRGMTSLLARPRRPGIDDDKNAAEVAARSLLESRRNVETLFDSLLQHEQLFVEAEAALQAAIERVPSEYRSLVLPSTAPFPREAIENTFSLAQKLANQNRYRWLRPITSLVLPLRLLMLRRRFLQLNDSIIAGWPRLSPPRNSKIDLSAMCLLCQRWLLFANGVDAAIQHKAVQTKIENLPNRLELSARLRDTKDQCEAAALRWLRLIAEASGAQIGDEHREVFAGLRAAMRNRPEDLTEAERPSEVAEVFREMMPELMRHFPLWAVSNLSVSKAIPLVAGVFDLVIVDEASQCDIASVIPLLYRARRAMIVGDPNQLPHITQITRDTEMRVRQSAKVSEFAFERYTFAANSMYDLAASSKARISVALRNHYRCNPEIAEYCNRTFYNGTLNIRTDADLLCSRIGLRRGTKACSWHHIAGNVIAASHGCYCPRQIEEILTELERLSDQEFGGSVGVVTPFRAQATRLSDLVHQRLSKARLNTWRFLVDTADGFQGDERDLVIFSLVGGKDMPPGSAFFLQSNPNRFNVAVSRARAVIKVFGDEEWAETCGIGFVTELLRRCRKNEGNAGKPRRDDLIGPVWEPRFADALRQAEITFEQQYPACGYFLDFALITGDRKIAVEIDGETYHRTTGGQLRIDDIYRDLVLETAGWRVLRFWVYQVREDIDECIARVKHEYAG